MNITSSGTCVDKAGAFHGRTGFLPDAWEKDEFRLR